MNLFLKSNSCLMSLFSLGLTCGILPTVAMAHSDQRPPQAADVIVVQRVSRFSLAFDRVPVIRNRVEQIDRTELAQLGRRDLGNREEDSPPQQHQKPAPGTPDEAVYDFCVALADDNTATASDSISTAAISTAEHLRNGQLSEEKIEELVKFLTPFSELTPVRQTVNTKRQLLNKRGQRMSFTLRKEKEAYKITEVSVSKPTK